MNFISSGDHSPVGEKWTETVRVLEQANQELVRLQQELPQLAPYLLLQVPGLTRERAPRESPEGLPAQALMPRQFQWALAEQRFPDSSDLQPAGRRKVPDQDESLQAFRRSVRRAAQLRPGEACHCR